LILKQLLITLTLFSILCYCNGQKIFNDTINIDKTRCISLGILEGGGALLGFDFEQMILRPVSAQVGAGFFGDAFDMGLNVHFTKSIDSPFLSFQYCIQQYQDNPKRCILGASMVYRGLKMFTCMVGYGREIHSSFLGSTTPEGNPNMIIFAVGIYAPFHSRHQQKIKN